MECTVTSDVDVHFEITWLFGGRDLSSVHPNKYHIRTIEPQGVTPTYSPVKKVSHLTMHRIQKEDEGEYTCNVKSTNAYLANEEELQVNLKVVSKPRFPANAPNIIWIDEETVRPGHPILVKLTCSVQADPIAALSWFQGGGRFGLHPSKMLKNSRLPASMRNVTAKMRNQPNTSSLTLRFSSIDDFKSLHILQELFPI